MRAKLRLHRVDTVKIARALGALALGVMVTQLALSPSARAQQEVPAPPASSSSNPSLQEVVVTATRVQRPGFTAPTPITVVSSADLQNTAATNVGSFLNQEIPALAATDTPTTTTQTIAGGGGNFVDLRDLGANRTLVLVDGHRFVPTTDIGTVDTNIIPSVLVDHVDVVTGGASADWGSDAVAGVVNIVLKKDLQGLEGNVQYGDSQHGGDRDVLASLGYGTSLFGGRGHFEVAGEYEDNDGILSQSDRDWAQGNYGLIQNPAFAPGNGQPEELILPNYQLSVVSAGGLITGGPLAGMQFGPGGVLEPFAFGSPNDGFEMSGGGGVEPGNYVVLQDPLKRGSLYTRASYDLTSNVTAYVDATIAATQATIPSVTPDFDLGTLQISVNNAFLPAAVRAQLLADGQTSFTMGRYNTDFGFNDAVGNELVQRYAAGLDGKFGNDWTWGAHVEDGVTRVADSNYRDELTGNYAQSVDSVINPATGQPVCSSTLSSPGNGCVPIDLFGYGAPSQAAINYITGTNRSLAYLRETSADANIQGEPFSDWAGPVSIATGVDYRRESVAISVDPQSQAGDFLIEDPQAESGAYNVSEAFLESVVPLIHHVPLIRSLDFDGAVRVTHYSTSGEVTTWKAGLSYSMTHDLRFRATRSRDIRAADLNELYSAPELNYGSVINPATGANVLITTYSRGNTALQPETADTTSAGIVYQPSWWRGFGISVDYYRIDIAGVIAQPSAQDVVTLCYEGDTQFCPLIQRDANGNPTVVTTTALNLNALRTNGVDLEADYSTPFGPGNLALRALATDVRQLITVDQGVAENFAGLIGNYGGGLPTIPHWMGNASLTYTLRPWVFFLQARYVGGGEYTNQFTVNNNTIPSVTYLNTSIAYTLSMGDGTLTIYGNVNNLLDKDPPIVPSTFFQPTQTNPQLYDVVGRAFALGVRFRY